MVVAACLLLEYGVSAAAVAVGWSQYLNEAVRQPVRLHDPGQPLERAGAGRHLQPARRDPDRALRLAADPRRERVGEGQRDHGADQDRRAGPVHRRRRERLGLRQPVRLHAVRRRRHRDGRRHHLLLLHRPGRGVDRRGGGAQPKAQPSAGDPHRAGHRDHALRPRGDRRGRRAAGRGVRGPGGRPLRDPRGGRRLELAGDRDRDRRGDIDLQRHAGRDLRADADPVRDEPRRHDSGVLPPAEPAHAHAGSVDDRLRRRHRAPRRRAADRLPRGDDEHRDAGRVPHRLRRSDRAAAAGTRPPARLQGAGLSRSRRSCRSWAASGSSRTCAR